MRTFISSLTILAGWLVCQSAAAGEQPISGTLYGVKEKDFMSYNCEIGSKDRIKCNFVQSRVAKLAKPSDWPKKLADAKAQAKKVLKELTSGNCSLDTDEKNFLNALRGGPQNVLTKEFREKLLELDLVQRDFTARYLEAMTELCTSKTESAFVALVKLGFEQETRTCRVSTSSFQQQFSWVADFEDEGAWVADPTPFGPCGVVQLSRFERDKTGGVQSSFWNFTARKAVTNPKGRVGGTQCGSWDQNAHNYVWLEPPAAHMQCDFIKFGF